NYTNNSTIEALDGSRVVLGSSANVIGGELTTAGSGFFELLSNSDLTGVTITTGSQVSQAQAQAVEVRSGLTNNGTWSVNSTGGTTTDTLLDFVGTQVLGGSGSIVLSEDFDNLIRATSSVVTQESGHTIRGSGQLLANSGGFVNNGSIIANNAGAGLRIDPGVEGFVNNAELRAENGATLTLLSGVYTNNATITAKDASVVEVASAAEIIGGQLRTTGTGIFSLLNNSDLTAVRITAGSSVVQSQAQNTEFRSGLINNGTLSVLSTSGTTTDTFLQFVGSQSIIGSGSIILSDDADNIITATSSVLTNGIGHTIRGAGTVLANSGGFNNLGFLFAEGSNVLNINPGVEGFSNSAGGTIGGTGTMNFVDGVLANDGILAAGIMGTGTLTIDADITNSASAQLAIQIAGSADSDLINVIGSYEAGGDIGVVLTSGFVPMAGETFVVLTATEGVSGNFANAVADASGIAVGVTSGAFTFDVVYEANQISIANVVPVPGTAALLTLAGIVATRRRRV
ncbi:MAG: hypothetical protein AAF356_06635, partial [Planctomycetota bacterium]